MGVLISGIAASNHVDSSGEILDIEGCDISTLAKDGTFNWEHVNDDSEDVVGKILYAKKIFSERDCETDDQLKFWKKVMVPYIYVIGELFDAQGHPGSVAIASMMRYSKEKNEPMMVGMSIEGSTLERDGMYLKRTVARRVALTVKPCNKSAIADVLEKIPDAKKAMGSDGYHPLAKGEESDFIEFSEDIPDQLTDYLADMIAFSVMVKTLTAGSMSAAPGNAVQGSALQKEKLDKDTRYKILETIRDKWDRITPMQEFLKNQMPELGEKFKDHFQDLMEDLSLKKGQSDIVSHRHTVHNIPHSKEQKLLIAGIRPKNVKGSEPYRTMNSMGDRVLVSRGHNSEKDNTFSSEKATAFHNLARDFFGLGEHVPTTAAFVSPVDRQVHHAVKAVPAIGGIHHKAQEHYDNSIKQMGSSDKLHKLAIMDYVLGHSNRHLNNFAVTKEGHPYLLSNHHAFAEPNMPDYVQLLDNTQKIVDMDTKNWADGLNEKDLATLVRYNGMPKEYAQKAVERLTHIKNKLKNQSSIMEIYHKE
jgi:hypothetical protein